MAGLAELARLDGMAQADLCARGEITADELFGACLERIDALNPLLRPVVTIARDLPAALPDTGPLRGVPFLMKDASPWPGLRWSMGSRLFRSRIAQSHTPLGRRLEQAGLLCVGKSAASEIGLLASTETLLEGVTHNPWSLAWSPGGSSGGSAVAVAAGLVPLAHASDGGGSIRIPASACGVFGFKPSRGRTVPASFGSSEFLDMTSDHCISRSVRDSALFLSITEDATASERVGFVRDPIGRRLRIATWTRTAIGEEPAPRVQRAHAEAVELLTALGHEVVPIAAPEYDRTLGDSFFVVAGAAVANIVEVLDRTRRTPVQRDELEPFSWALVDDFLARGPDALPRARASFAQAVRVYDEAMRGFDVVLTPTLAAEPWPTGHLSPVLEHEELLKRTGRINGYAPLSNLTGGPAMSVPLHFAGEEVPIGMHFAASPGTDALLLGLAYQLEEARPWAGRWPRYSIPALEAARSREE